MEKEDKCKWCEKTAVTKKEIPNINRQFDTYYDVCQNEDCILKLDYLFKNDRNMILFQFVTMIGIVPLLSVGLSVLFNLGSVLFFLKDENYSGLFYHIDIMSSSLILLLLLIIFYPINIIGDFFLSVKIKKKRNWKEIIGFVMITIASLILLDFSWQLISNSTIQNVIYNKIGYNFFFLPRFSEHFLLYLSIAIYVYFSKFFKKTNLVL